jgi:formylglycine-generating enzyme required for sulfatase activity
MAKYAIALALAGMLLGCAGEKRYPTVPDTLDDVEFGNDKTSGELSTDAGFFFQDMPPGSGVVVPHQEVGVNAAGYREFRRNRDGVTEVLIPAGYFHKRAYWDTPGTEERHEGSWVHLPAMLVDKYEVTNMQVARFLHRAQGARFEDGKATGPDGKPWASDHQWGLRITAEGARSQPGYENHPAVGVSGWLALAYAKWVGGDLLRGSEFEKAAAGPAGLLFPWGNEDKLPDSTRANSYLHGPKRTMPVGSYPDGASPYGLLDMAGNVYERAYWDGDVSADPEIDLGNPTMLKGGGWVSPNWWNLRCVCRCGQGMDAMDGSVGFRVVVRDPDVLAQIAPEPPKLRVFTDTRDAYDEAADRNVPIFLYMGYERCGQCDRLQAQLFADPEFVEYCNRNLVVLIGHNIREFNDLPKTPTTDNGTFFAHTGAKLAEMRQVWEDFALWRSENIVPLPDSVSLFQISPGLFLLNPHRHRITNPEDAVLVGDETFMGHKNGGDRELFFKLFKQAQEKLGPGQSHEDFEADKPAPETTWNPTPEDAVLWERAKADMAKLAKALGSYHTEYGEYPQTLHDLRPYFQRQILPQDPFLGTYYRYKRTETGYELTCYGKGDKPGGEAAPDKDIVITK